MCPLALPPPSPASDFLGPAILLLQLARWPVLSSEPARSTSWAESRRAWSAMVHFYEFFTDYDDVVSGLAMYIRTLGLFRSHGLCAISCRACSLS